MVKKIGIGQMIELKKVIEFCIIQSWYVNTIILMMGLLGKEWDR